MSRVTIGVVEDVDMLSRLKKTRLVLQSLALSQCQEIWNPIGTQGNVQEYSRLPADG